MKKNKILVFSSDPSVITPLKGSFDIEGASTHKEFIKKVEANPGLPAVIDCDTKDAKGLPLFREIKKLSPSSAVIMMSSTATIPEAVDASKLGVADFIRKPALNERLVGSVKSALSGIESAEIRLSSRPKAWLLGGSNSITKMFKHLEAAVREKKNVLFISGPGVDVSSLVGLICDHTEGGKKLATIDMVTFRKESIENIFWMVLQEAMNSSDIIYFDRFHAAGEKQRGNILDYIRKKTPKGHITLMASFHGSGEGNEFLGWEKITVPALDQRKEDIPDMLSSYIKDHSAKYGKKIENISLDAVRAVTAYSWPGNYRELECVIENAVIACGSDTITLKDIPMGSRMLSESLRADQKERLLDFRNSVEKGLTDIFLKKTGSEDAAADLLDISKSRISEILNS